MLELKQVGAFRCFEGTFSFDTTATGASDYVLINPDSDRVSIQLSVLSTAKAGVEATISTENEILADTALWKLWGNGLITGGDVSQDSTNGPVRAIRINVDTAKAGINAYLSVATQGSKI